MEEELKTQIEALGFEGVAHHCYVKLFAVFDKDRNRLVGVKANDRPEPGELRFGLRLIELPGGILNVRSMVPEHLWSKEWMLVRPIAGEDKLSQIAEIIGQFKRMVDNCHNRI